MIVKLGDSESDESNVTMLIFLGVAGGLGMLILASGGFIIFKIMMGGPDDDEEQFGFYHFFS